DKAVPDAVGGFIEHDGNGALSFLYLLASFGLTPLSPDERHIVFNNASGTRALEVFRGFGYAGQAARDMSRRQARRTFQAGKMGVFVPMTSVLPSLMSGPVGQGVAVKPLPLASAQGRVPAAGPVGVILTDATGRRDRALDFLRFAAS